MDLDLRDALVDRLVADVASNDAALDAGVALATLAYLAKRDANDVDYDDVMNLNEEFHTGWTLASVIDQLGLN